MSAPIRVLHVIGYLNRGGAEAMLMNLYRNMDRTKVQFDFVENDGEEAAYEPEIRALGGKIFRCPRYRGKNHIAYTRWWEDFWQAHSGEYPIVHGHIGSTAAIYLSIAKKHGVYTIAHSHSTGGSLSYRLFAYPTRFVADHFFACSRDAAISRYGKGVGRNVSRCQVLKNAIDTEKFSFSPEIRKTVRKQLGIGENTLVVGHVGRFVKAKNHPFLLESFRCIHARQPDSVLLLVGDGDLRPQIEAQIAQYHLQDAVRLAGERADTWNYYQAMDVFLFPSHFEGLGIVTLEAQTAGLPCFVSDGIPEEAGVTDLFRRLPLAWSAEAWAQQVLAHAFTPRRDRSGELKKAGYDIGTTSQWLENYYREVAAHG